MYQLKDMINLMALLLNPYFYTPSPHAFHSHITSLWLYFYMVEIIITLILFVYILYILSHMYTFWWR